jgi:hypothetical protein
MTETIEQMLDRVSEYESKRDNIEAEKRALLDEVKVPAEVLALQDETNKKIQAFESEMRARTEAKRKEIYAKLDAVKVPDEVRAIFDAVAKQRAEIESELTLISDKNRELATETRQKMYAEMQASVSQIYADIAARKAEIEAEFLGKSGAVDENIAALKKEIEAAVLAEGKTYQGEYLMAVWNKGRIGSWNTGKLDGLALILPQIAECRNPGGEPTVTFRRK